MTKSNLSQKAKAFHDLHYKQNFLLLPNIWEPMGAALLEQIGFGAVATGSGAIANTNGYADGEKMPVDEVYRVVETIVQAVNIPVSVDFEAGYASNHKELEENIEKLIDIGVVGLNIEDSDPATGKMIPIEDQCNKIKIIKDVSARRGVEIFINARTDAYIHGTSTEAGYAISESLKRGEAYKKAGAHCIYPITMHDENEIKQMVNVLKMPINILTIKGIPEFKILRKIGVARVSLGSSFLKIAIKAMKSSAEKLFQYEGLEEITHNEITSEFLRKLRENKS